MSLMHAYSEVYFPEQRRAAEGRHLTDAQRLASAQRAERKARRAERSARRARGRADHARSVLDGHLPAV